MKKQNLLLFISIFRAVESKPRYYPQQEYIPVGCVSPAIVDVRGGVPVAETPWPGQRPPPRQRLPRHDRDPQGRDPIRVETTWPGQTDACENITFPRLRLRAVNIVACQVNNKCLCSGFCTVFLSILSEWFHKWRKVGACNHSTLPGKKTRYSKTKKAIHWSI